MTEPAGAIPDPGDLLVVGDVHLGRRPVGLDDRLSEIGLKPRDLSPAAALRRLVDHAEEHPPRAVLFAGDLVDEEKDRFEAYGVLQAQAERLVALGVPVYVVAGNHDGLVLPRLVERVPGVTLLGKGGRWERVEVPGDGPHIDMLGWSFPARHVSTNPLDAPGFDDARVGTRPGARVIGLLHADLDAGAGSRYAPVSRERLRSAGCDAWFVGHVHAPDDLSGPRPVGYLGSLVGLDPGEAGPRGAWRARVSGEGVTATQLALGPVRWESIDVPLDDEAAADADAVHARIESVVSERCEPVVESSSSSLKVIVVRAHVTGRLTDRASVRELSARIEQGLGGVRAHGVPVIVQRVVDATRPAVDLRALAGEPSPVGFLAKRLLDLDGEARDEILERARGGIEGLVKAGGWGLDEDDEELAPPSPEAIYRRAAWRALDLLLEQRGEVAG